MTQLVEVNGQTIEFPDGMAVSDIEAAIKKNFLSIPKAKPAPLSTLKPVAPDPTEGMGALDKAMAGAGKAVADLGRSAGQGVRWLSPKLADAIGAPTDADIAEAQRLDAPLMATGAGIAGNIGGNLAMALMPGTGQLGAAKKINDLWKAGTTASRLAAVGGAAGMGAVQNAVFNPRGTDETLARQLELGSAMGAGGQVAGPVLAAGVQGLRNIKAGSLGTAGQTLTNFAGVDPAELTRLIKAGNRELVPGSAPTTVQATQNAGLARLKAAMGAMYPNNFTGVDAQQNAARLAALNGISEVTGTAAEAANNAGGQMFREGSAAYGQAKDATSRAYAAIDPFNEARISLPIPHVEAAARKYFGPGSGGMPGELGRLVNDIKTLGTVTEDPAIAANFKELVMGKASRPSAAKGIDVDRDPLDVAIRKWGGVNIDQGGGELKWLRESDLGKASVVHGPLARRNGAGENWDYLAERAHEFGYIDAPDQRLLMEKLGESARGNPVYSAYGGGDSMAARAGAFDDMPDEFLKPLQSPGVVNLETLQNLRSRAGEMAYKAGLSGDQRLKAAAGQIKDHLDGALEAAAGRSAVGQVLESGVDLPQAMYRKGLGEIDFPYGNVGTWDIKKGKFVKGSGLSHVVGNRDADGVDGVAEAMSLPDVLAHGKVLRTSGEVPGNRRINIGLGDAEAILSEGPNGHWLLNGWDNGLPVGVKPEVLPESNYARGQSFIRDRMGATGSGDSVGVPGEYFKPDMAQFMREARQARIDQGNRFETGFAKRMWVDGADGMPKLTGGEIPRAAFNSGATQAQDIAQWGLMGRPGESALKNYAITNLVESAAPNGLLSPDKVGKWTRGRSEAIKGLLDTGEQATLSNVTKDLQRAAAADALERVKGQSNTAEKLTSLGLLDNKVTDYALRALAHLPAGGVLGAPLEGGKEALKRWKYKDVPDALLDPVKALKALKLQEALMQQTMLQRGLLSPLVQQGMVPALTAGD